MDNLYHVSIRTDTPHIKITRIDTFTLEKDISGVYMSETDLPEWVRRKLSALSFCDWGKRSTGSIDGVGKRINEHDFWIYN